MSTEHAGHDLGGKYFSVKFFITGVAVMAFFGLLDRFVLQHGMNKLENLILPDDND